MEPFSVLEDIQGQSNLWRLPLLLDPEQRTLKVEPKTDFLVKKNTVRKKLIPVYCVLDTYLNFLQINASKSYILFFGRYKYFFVYL